MKCLPRMVRSRQEGQAIVELAIAAMFFLIPLYLIVVALGKFADVQSTSSQAARYAAWERTVWYSDDDWRNRMDSAANTKTSAQMRSEIAQRIVGIDDLELHDTDKSKNSLSNGTLTTWTDAEGKQLLEKYDDLQLVETKQGVGAKCATCVIDTALPLPSPFNIGINVPQNEMVIATSTIGVGANSAAMKVLFPSYTGWNGALMNDKVALLPNEWMANGSKGAVTVTKDAVLTARGPEKLLLEAAVKAPMELFVTEIRDLKVGDIEPDEVPTDRLK